MWVIDRVCKPYFMEKTTLAQNKIWQEQSIFIISPILDKSQIQ